MDALIPELATIRARYERASQAIVEALGAPQAKTQSSIPAEQLIEGMNQFLTLATRFEDKTQVQEDAAELGDYGVQLVMDLTLLATRLKLEQAQQDLELLTLSICAWILRHQGELRTLEPIVDALANHANRLREPAELEQLSAFVDNVIQAIDNVTKQDLEKGDSGRPWRVLLWNRGIIATRSHDTAVIERVYDEFVQYLPEEAGDFFQQAMQQMQALDYPETVTTVVQRYYDRFTRHSMH